ncbi:hypothetical protein M885DRAFT_515002 [Pelagophyceae sp. CCMP2097]|nr:hypothetical protein M885DRAFT_515002 [Pelagophyceae sp. CCMP2097]
MLITVLLALCASVDGLRGRGPASPRRRAIARAESPEASEVVRKLAEAAQRLGDAAAEARRQWVGKGWQVRKRAGQWLPEVLPQQGASWATSEVEALEAGMPALRDANDDEKGRLWIATTSEASRALVSTQLDAQGRGVAVASEFSRFLTRDEVKSTFTREKNGALIFASEAALATSVAAFAGELTRELSAAARALARYVDDLEGELAAADEGTVRLRVQLSEAEKEAERRTAVAAREVVDAEKLRLELEVAAADVARARDAAAASERAAEAASLDVDRLEASEFAGVTSLAEARATAIALEERLVDAERAAARAATDEKAALRKSETAERSAAAAAAARDAVEGVVAAMERRALAAEDAAQQAADRLETALARTAVQERELAEALRKLEDEAAADPDVGDAAGLDEARAAQKALVELSTPGALPALSSMRKSALIQECASRGLDAKGFKVPELRAALRTQRRKDTNKEPKEPAS